MLIRNLREFRKFDKSYVKITNISKKLITQLNIEKLKEPLFGIIYIDYENGITIRILGDENKILSDKMLIIRADCFNDMKIETIDKYNLDSNNKYLHQIIENYYNKGIEEIRNEASLDEFRHSEFPDDVQVLLPIEDKFEQMWVKLFMKTNQDNLYIGKLLNSSYIDNDYLQGKNVAIIYYNQGDTKVLIINGLVKFKD